MRQQWEQQKAWSDRFLPEIKAILGQHLIGEPPVAEDTERNTDLMVLRMEAVRIGCRIRKIGYLRHYGDEFTIRAELPTGTKTELAKIIEGWGDYFFYGFADSYETHLIKWTLADMRVFRGAYSRMIASPSASIALKKNADGSKFAAFRWSVFPPELVVATAERVAA